MDYKDFLASELEKWPMAADNFSHVRSSIAEGRRVTLIESEDYRIDKLYVNHRRASATAKTDAASVAKRPCFLCAANRPATQSAIRWRDYEILVNPFPVADMHFTVPSVRHEPQAISTERILDMAALSREFSDMCVFYNGAKCGASAPDHFHFQIVSTETVPLIKATFSDSQLLAEKTGSQLLCNPAPGSQPIVAPFPFFIIKSTSDDGLTLLFETIMKALSEVEGNISEPPVNIAMTFDTKHVEIITLIIPRGKHRPACYGSGEGQMLTSPASVEMLGTIICSCREDFDLLDSQTAIEILSEVGMPISVFSKVMKCI